MTASRLWIVPELTLAREAHCITGKHLFILEDLLTLMTFLIAHGCPRSLMLSEGYQRLFALLNTMDRFSPSRQRPLTFSATPALSELLHAQRRYACTDPRDRVFALISLLDPEARVEIERILGAGYHMTVMEVWCSIPKLAIFATGNLNDLGYEREDLSIDPYGLPSWMPSLEFKSLDLALDFSTIYSTANRRQVVAWEPCVTCNGVPHTPRALLGLRAIAV